MGQGDNVGSETAWPQQWDCRARWAGVPRSGWGHQDWVLFDSFGATALGTKCPPRTPATVICNSSFSLPCPLQPSFENAPPVTVCPYAQCEFCVSPLLSSRTAPALPQVGPGRADGSHRTGRAGSPSSPARPSPCPSLLRGSPLGSHTERAYGGLLSQRPRDREGHSCPPSARGP